jgi:ribosomal protein S18 acetylase RimI-like enzyme
MNQIRLLSADDAVAYKELRLKALTTNPESFLATFEAENLKSLASFSAELRYSLSEPIFGYYGIFEDNHLVGYAFLEKSYLEKQQHVAFFYNLYIHPDYRGKKLASKLFEFLLTQLKEKTKIERLFLSCNQKNQPAQELYKKLGFKPYAIKEKSIKWQGQYDDEIEMVMEL